MAFLRCDLRWSTCNCLLYHKFDWIQQDPSGHFFEDMPLPTNSCGLHVDSTWNPPGVRLTLKVCRLAILELALKKNSIFYVPPPPTSLRPDVSGNTISLLPPLSHKISVSPSSPGSYRPSSPSWNTSPVVDGNVDVGSCNRCVGVRVK
jgi:hypothetical protein